jgi:inositol phosphorylceramide mannosyltransferase catalytic subunit
MHTAESYNTVRTEAMERIKTREGSQDDLQECRPFDEPPRDNPGDEQTRSRIPKRIIQIWIDLRRHGSHRSADSCPETPRPRRGGSARGDLPLLCSASMANARLLNPNFEYMFFDDKAVEAFIQSTFPQYKDAFYAFKYPIQRCDFFRYLAVFHYGGFYLDLDVFLVSELTNLLQHACVFSFEELTLNKFLRNDHGLDWEVGNYAFGAEAGNPFIGEVIKNCVRAQTDRQWVKEIMNGIPRMFHKDFYILNTTGPGLVSRTLAENPRTAEGVTILLPDDMRDKRMWHCFGEFGIHLAQNAWRDNPSLFYRRSFVLWMWWNRRALLKNGPRAWRIGPSITSGWTR